MNPASASTHTQSLQTSIPSLLKRHKPQLIAGIVTLSAVDLIQMGIPLVIRRATDAFVAGGTDAASIIRICALYILAMGLVMAVSRLGWRYFIMGSARKIEQSLRNEFFSHLQKLDTGRVKSRKTGDLMAHTVSDIETLKFACGLGVLVAYDGLFLLVFITGAIIYISPGIAAVLCVPFALMMFFIFKGGRAIERRFRKTQDSFSSLTESARMPVHGIKAVKSLRAEQTETDKFRRASLHYAHSNMHFAKLWAVYQPAIYLCVGTAGAIFLFFGGGRAITGSITLGDFTALLVYLTMLSWPMMAMGWAQDILRRGNSSINRLNSIFKLPAGGRNCGGKENFSRRSKKLEVRDVSASFGGTEVLSGCSFEASAGETVFIVGGTGSGKTTLAEIITANLDPKSGRIRIDGTDVFQAGRGRFAGRVISVDRSAFIFSGTVRENINFMRPRPEEKTREAADICGITGEIERFEGGFDSLLGERGINISEGQKQRISIARAVMFEPAVLILDDALSSVDLSTEAKVVQNLISWARRTRTIFIIIASRTNSCRFADRILVLSGGKVAESGTHEQLVSLGGIYSKMHAIQTR